MPVYDYLCEECGPFTQIRPMSEYAKPQVCPACDIEAPRAILVAPNFACMPTAERRARSVNEQSAHAPKTLEQYKAAHGANCGCCKGKPARLMTRTKGGAKGFPTARPWMISH